MTFFEITLDPVGPSVAISCVFGKLTTLRYAFGQDSRSLMCFPSSLSYSRPHTRH